MSGADYFDDGFAINSYMDDHVPVHLERAIQEHNDIKLAFERAGIEVIKVDPPDSSQDGVYTANWALTRGNKAVMANLPNKRQPEEKYAQEQLEKLGFETVKLPNEFHFSGQGDALPCGNYLFTGTSYRTSHETHPLLARELGYEVIGVQAIPELDSTGKPVTNPVTGWPDSFFYDIDLAIAVIAPNVIAWCPDALLPESQKRIQSLPGLEKIEVSFEEATKGFACNLVSTGETVIMSAHAPNLEEKLKAHGLEIIKPNVSELAKGGGFIRCSSLTLNND